MFNDDVPPLERVYKGERVSLLVLGRAYVADLTPEVPYLVISVTDPDKSDAFVLPNPLLRAILRLRFHDNSQTVVIPGLEGISLGEGTETPMTREDAHAILAFVQEHLDEVELIVCQCEAGVSRSAGIAAALSRILQGNDQFFFANYWPNRWVYRTILDASAQGQGADGQPRPSPKTPFDAR